MTEECLPERAEHGDYAKYEAAPAAGPDVEPEERDRF
jgi:hypothetical protein